MSPTNEISTSEKDLTAKQIHTPFELPPWFVKEHVHIYQGSPDAVHSCVVSDNEDSESASGAATPSTNGSSEAHTREDMMEEIQDTIVGAMASSEKDKLPVRQAAIIIGVNGESPKNQDLIDTYVDSLARTMRAQLVSFDLDDLETLATAFKLQEDEGNPIEGCGPDCDECKKATRSPNADEPSAPYFATPSLRKGTTHFRDRSRKAIAALFQDFSARKDRLASRIDLSGQAEDQEHASSCTGYRLIYVKDAPRLLEITKGWRFISRFREGIEEQRRANNKVMLVVAEPTDTSYRLQEKLKISAESKFCLDAPVSTADEVADYQSKAKLQRNMRTLTGSILTRFPATAPRDQFPVSTSAWEAIFSKTLTKQLGKNSLTKGEIHAMVLQILGRAAQKSMPETEDVVAVLERYMRRANKKGKGSESENDDDKSGKKDSSSEPPPLSEILQKIKDDGEGHEVSLLDCVVDPKTLESTYDNVIIDPETIGTVKQLLAQSKLRADGSSHLLLRELRITGLLFYGPPGTGKTHLARAIAKESGLNLLAIKSSDVQDMWLGEAEKRIHSAFTLATKLHPSVLFIDEADALFYRRGTDDKSWQRSFLTQILQEMDGLVKSEKRPLVIVATNRPSDLDEAFLRRLPHRVHFGLPSEADRAKILRVFLHADDLDDSVDIDGLASRTRGFSGSDLRSLCAQAALAWAVEQPPASDVTPTNGDDPPPSTKVRLTVKHFQKAMQRTFPSVTAKTLRDADDFGKR